MRTPSGAVKSDSAALPVFRVAVGSKSRTSASSSAAVRCSKPRGTTRNSPSFSSTTRSQKFDPHPAAPNEEQFVLRVVMVPRKCPLEFYKLYFLTVQFPDDFGPPMFCKGTELFREVHFFHGAPHLTATSLLRKPDYSGKTVAHSCRFSFCNRRALFDDCSPWR